MGRSIYLFRLDELQIISGPSTERASKIIRIGAWNLERGRDWREAARVIREQRLDIVLLSEMDYGMSRPQVTTLQLKSWPSFVDLNWVYLGACDTLDPENIAGLHGLIISRFPLMALSVSVQYEVGPNSTSQLGARIALGALIDSDW